MSEPKSPEHVTEDRVVLPPLPPEIEYQIDDPVIYRVANLIGRAYWMGLYAGLLSRIRG